MAGELHERYGVSQRHICTALRFSRSSLQYKPKRNAMNEVLCERIKEIAAARVRYGYRRIHVLLQLEVGRSTSSASRGSTRKKA